MSHNVMVTMYHLFSCLELTVLQLALKFLQADIPYCEHKPKSLPEHQQNLTPEIKQVLFFVEFSHAYQALLEAHPTRRQQTLRGTTCMTSYFGQKAIGKEKLSCPFSYPQIAKEDKLCGHRPYCHETKLRVSNS